MAIHDLVSGYGNFSVVPREMVAEPIVLRRYIDTTVTPLLSGEVYKILAFPANSLIVSAAIVVGTVEGAGDTLDLYDDSSGSNTLVSNADMNTQYKASVYVSGAIFKDTAEYLSLHPDNDLTVCKFWVEAMIIPLRTTN